MIEISSGFFWITTSYGVTLPLVVLITLQINKKLHNVKSWLSMYDFILNPVFFILFDLLQFPLHLLQLSPPGPEQDLNRVKTSPVDVANCTL